MKLEYFVVCENSSDCLDTEHYQIKIKVNAGLQTFSPFTTIQTISTNNSTFVQAGKLILSMYVYLTVIYKIYEYRHA